MNLTAIILMKEKLVIGEPLTPRERDFILDAINFAITFQRQEETVMPENSDVKLWIDGWMDKVKHRTETYIAQGVPKEEAEERALFEIRMEIRRAPPMKMN